MQTQNSNGVAWTGFSRFQQAQAKDSECNLLNQEEEDHVNNGAMFDPGGTVDHFKNPDLIQDIHQTKKVTELKTSAGSKLNNEVAWLSDHGEVWFDKDALANTMALKNVKKMFKVNCDSKVENAFILTHQEKGCVTKFECQKKGFCAFAPLAACRNLSKNGVQDVSAQEVNNLTEMMKGNVEEFTAR